MQPIDKTAHIRTIQVFLGTNNVIARFHFKTDLERSYQSPGCDVRIRKRTGYQCDTLPLDRHLHQDIDILDDNAGGHIDFIRICLL